MMQLFVKYRVSFKITGILALFLMIGCSNEDTAGSEETSPVEEVTEDDLSEATEQEERRNRESVENTIDNLGVVWSQSDTIESGLEWTIEEEEQDTFWLEISGIGLTDVLGVAFHLEYDPQIIELTETSSTEILRDNFTDIATVIREEPGQIRFGSVRLHDPGNYGQPPNYTGVDIEKGVIARFQFRKKAAGDMKVDLPSAARDLRNSELSRVELNLRTGTATIENEVSQ